jgi:hypothetical protein
VDAACISISSQALRLCSIIVAQLRLGDRKLSADQRITSCTRKSRLSSVVWVRVPPDPNGEAAQQAAGASRVDSASVMRLAGILRTDTRRVRG